MTFPRLPRLVRFVLLLLVAVPLLSWWIVRPVRMLAPRLAGVHCVSASLCLDDSARAAEAQQLSAEGLGFVAHALAPLAGTPRLIFCATQACAESFGLGARSAVTMGSIGTVIGPRAWKPHYVRHELIHQLQAQQLGTLALLFKPSWFVEGMAYGLSQDPRPVLSEPFEGYRQRFQAWYQQVGPQQLWQQARGL